MNHSTYTPHRTARIYSINQDAADLDNIQRQLIPVPAPVQSEDSSVNLPASDDRTLPAEQASLSVREPVRPSRVRQVPRRIFRAKENQSTHPETAVIQTPQDIVDYPRNVSAESAVESTARTQLSHHQTEFNVKEKERSTNISLAAAALNNQIVQPGQTFSYNETVGPTNERRGFKKSTIFIDGEKSEGFGGGVCQVSTTLYQAAKSAGLTILERHDHSLPVTYAETGEDAATSYGIIDFKFKNDHPYSIQINTATEPGKVSVTINRV